MPSSPARAGTTAVAAVASAVLMLVLVTWAAAIGPEKVFTGGGTFVRDTAGPIASTTATQSAGPDLQDEVRDKYGTRAPAWVRVLAVAIEAAVLVVVLYLLVRLLRRLHRWWRGRERRRGRTVPPIVDFEVLDPTAEVAAAIEEDAAEQREQLEAGEPRNAIVACWRRFEQQAARADVVRRPWQTSSEFVLGVLGSVGADEGAVLELATLFREARFSDHPITEQHRDRALAALAAIHGSLGTSQLASRRPL
jgi:hypothetical protein